jgi:hypothetical protein
MMAADSGRIRMRYSLSQMKSVYQQIHWTMPGGFFIRSIANRIEEPGCLTSQTWSTARQSFLLGNIELWVTFGILNPTITPWVFPEE